MGGDVELCELVAVEWEREEGGNHLGTNHRVREPWKGCSEIDDKEGQMFSAARIHFLIHGPADWTD